MKIERVVREDGCVILLAVCERCGKAKDSFTYQCEPPCGKSHPIALCRLCFDTLHPAVPAP